MKKYLFVLLLIIPFRIWAINLYSPKYIIYDNTEDKVLMEKQKDVNTSIASLTKIMTAMVIIDEVKDLDKKITVTSSMLSSVPTGAFTIHLGVGETYTYRDLLYGILLPSAADAATILSISSSGSVKNFVQKMNDKAKSLGLTHTHFTNPVGMDNSDNKCTLEDILALLKYALKNETFRTIYETKKYTLSSGKVIDSSLKMYNEDLNLNLDTSRMIGTKTGYTKKAGFALSQIFESKGHEIISITIGAKHNNQSYHLRDGISIIKYIDDNYDNQLLLEKNTLLKKMEVKNSTIDEYDIYSQVEIKKYLPNDYKKEDFKIVYHLPEYLDYKSEEHIGSIEYYFQDELVGKEEVILNVKIKPNLISWIKDHIIFILIGIIILISVIFALLKRKRVKFAKV